MILILGFLVVQKLLVDRKGYSSHFETDGVIVKQGMTAFRRVPFRVCTMSLVCLCHCRQVILPFSSAVLKLSKMSILNSGFTTVLVSLYRQTKVLHDTQLRQKD